MVRKYSRLVGVKCHNMDIYRVNKPKTTICSSCKAEYPESTHCTHNVRFEDYPERHGLRRICANCKWFSYNITKERISDKDCYGVCCYNPPTGKDPARTKANYSCRVYEKI